MPGAKKPSTKAQADKTRVAKPSTSLPGLQKREKKAHEEFSRDSALYNKQTGKKTPRNILDAAYGHTKKDDSVYSGMGLEARLQTAEKAQKRDALRDSVAKAKKRR